MHTVNTKMMRQEIAYLETLGQPTGTRRLLNFITAHEAKQVKGKDVKDVKEVQGGVATLTTTTTTGTTVLEIKAGERKCMNSRCERGKNGGNAVLPVSEMLQCSRCKKAKYCSKACQVEDWPRHRLFCLCMYLACDLSREGGQRRLVRKVKGKEAPIFMCQKCDVWSYCSQDCLDADWLAHEDSGQCVPNAIRSDESKAMVKRLKTRGRRHHVSQDSDTLCTVM
jgi:hypothetical protein